MAQRIHHFNGSKRRAFLKQSFKSLKTSLVKQLDDLRRGHYWPYVGELLEAAGNGGYGIYVVDGWGKENAATSFVGRKKLQVGLRKFCTYLFA